ncbi:MAG: class I SAM-dependent methyltransferase [Xanthobacteraceae bacterium]
MALLSHFPHHQSAERSSIMVDRPAGFFEGTEMPTAGWWEALWPAPRNVLTAVGISSGMEVVDLCSGDGWFTLEIAKLARHVVAIDIDPKLLKIAQTHLRENAVTNCNLVAGDAYDLGRLVGRPTDFVFMANAYHGVPDKPRLSRAVHESLKPGGRFASVNWHRRPREETPILGEPRGPRTELRISPEDTVAAVTPAGLRLLGIVDLPPYHYGAVFERPNR